MMLSIQVTTSSVILLVSLVTCIYLGEEFLAFAVLSVCLPLCYLRHLKQIWNVIYFYLKPHLCI